MTAQEKQRITQLRGEGKSYGAIAAELGITSSKVKSFCIRHELGGTRSNVGRTASGAGCEQCGTSVLQAAGRKHKRFCSDACRMKWWNSHRDKVDHRALRKRNCLFCGAEYMVYSTSEKKYCSHRCYISFRFGGGSNG